ncbi:hypothetical protein BS78_08G065400 [Paspalum vaginatum]|nr:hypothetical protein BS78_08G065400 [Paspalum vaginatum]
MEELSMKVSAAPTATLLSLCLDAVAARLTGDSARAGSGRPGWRGRCGGGGLGEVPDEDGREADHESLYLEQVAEVLPWELLHRLASQLPPVALQSLHHAAHAHTSGLGVQGGDIRGVKRSRCEDFNANWQLLFKLRWPLTGKIGHDNLVTVDWHQKYWEKHLQECLDEAAESALLPSFRGTIGELTVSDKIMNFIYQSKDTSQHHSSLAYQCSKFGCYVRCLRLQGVLCNAESYDLLQHCKLERLMFIRIISEPEVTGVCLLLRWHAETLLSLEFIHCQLYHDVMNKICESVCQMGSQSHGIQQFSIKSSRICEAKPLTISAGLLNFISSGKVLHLLLLNDIKMPSPFAQMVIHTLLESSCGLHILEISENDIAGWRSKANQSFTTSSLAPKSDVSLNFLSVLNLRGNNLQKDDVLDLNKILIRMPNLRDLDISGNPIMDEGIRLLIPFISCAIQKENPLLRLVVENCDLTSIGVSKLLECLTFVKQPLDELSIAENPLGSKNRGGIRAAYFVSRLILQAPNLVSINAAANLLPPESLEIICSSLKQRTCNLEQVDLTDNMHLSGNIFPGFLEFERHGKPILVVPSTLSICAPYDDDP